MELRTSMWGEVSAPLSHSEMKLHPLLISPNNLIGGINRIAQILKNANADPKNKKTIKIVKLCWELACELPTGKKILRACRACLELPETEDFKAKTKLFTFKINEGDEGYILNFPTFFKDALAADSPYFKALFTNGMRESTSDEVGIHDAASESFVNLIRCWLAQPNEGFCFGVAASEAQLPHHILIDGIFFGISPKIAEEALCSELVRWEVDYENNFEEINKIVDQFLLFPSEAIKITLGQFFLNLYGKTKSKEIKALCEGYLRQLLKVPTISRQIKVELKHLLSVLKLQNRGWSVTNLTQKFVLPNCAEAFDLLANSPGIHSLDAAGCTGLTDEILKEIAKNLYIRTLVLERCQSLTDKGVVALAGSYITHLNLALCKKLTDRSIILLAKKMSLAVLNLRGCDHLTDVSLSALACVQTLTELNVRECQQLTHAGIKSLARNENLRRLNFSHFHDSLIDE